MSGYSYFKENKNDKDYTDPASLHQEKEDAELLSRAHKNLDVMRQYASFFRAYPDKFIDLVTPKDSKFKLFFYQRLFLRVCMRNRYVYATFTRGFSKSFLSILTLYLKCLFFPGIKLFICTAGKEQAANIAKDKIAEIQELFPALSAEVKKLEKSKDYLSLIFHNGSKIDIIAVQNSSRGLRRHGGLTLAPCYSNVA
jgi:membrane protein insertase Oxa1/YidC/SpoIIIJ